MKINKILQIVWVSCLMVSALSAQDKIVLKGKELFGDIKARHIGPALMSGRMTDIELHPTNNKIVYAAAAGGGGVAAAGGCGEDAGGECGVV